MHLQGGALALVTAWLIGPRIGKYGKDGKVNAIAPHHIPMVQVGTFILAFGWFGFNAGSSLAGSRRPHRHRRRQHDDRGHVRHHVAACVYMWMVHGKPDPSMMCNSMLAGLVAITSPCAFVTPVGAFIIGLVAGVLVVWSVFFFDRIKIDDPVGAISVHGVNGAWGLIAVGLFSDGSVRPGMERRRRDRLPRRRRQGRHGALLRRQQAARRAVHRDAASASPGTSSLAA